MSEDTHILAKPLIDEEKKYPLEWTSLCGAPYGGRKKQAYHSWANVPDDIPFKKDRAISTHVDPFSLDDVSCDACILLWLCREENDAESRR